MPEVLALENYRVSTVREGQRRRFRAIHAERAAFKFTTVGHEHHCRQPTKALRPVRLVVEVPVEMSASAINTMLRVAHLEVLGERRPRAVLRDDTDRFLKPFQNVRQFVKVEAIDV